MSEATLIRGSIGSAQVYAGRERLVTRPGEAGAIVFGPYEERSPGRYRVEFELARAPGQAPLGDPVAVKIDVLTNRGVTLLAEERLLFSSLADDLRTFALEIDLQESRTLEYRIVATGKVGICCTDKVSVERVGETSRLSAPLSADAVVWQNEREFLDGYLRNVKGLIHVGASMGQERRYYWLLGLDVVWVEPIKEVYDILVDHISRYPRQKAVNALLANRSGEPITFRIANNAGASSSILPLEDHARIFPTVQYSQERTIVSTTLSEVIRKHDIPLEHYEALTLDVEGAERLVLEGGLDILDRFKYIKCEVADFPIRAGSPTVEDLDAILAPRGFKELGRRSFTDGPDNQGTAWDVVWKRVAPGETLHEPGRRLPLVFDPIEVEAVEKCE